MYEMSKNILDCYISGLQYYDAYKIMTILKVGAELDLRNELDNPYDCEAVAVYYGDIKLGYIPREVNGLITKLLYFNYADIFECYVVNINENESLNSGRKIEIAIKLIDDRI